MKRLHRFCEWLSALVFVQRRWLLLSLIFSACVLAFLYQWGYVCTNTQPQIHIENICTDYANGKAAGKLCSVLCRRGYLSSISCQNFHYGKQTVFSGKWDNISIIFKSPKPTNTKLMQNAHGKYPTEKEFANMVKSNIKLKFNMEINDIDVKKMAYYQYSKDIYQRHIEMANLWSLLQDNEYLALSLYEKYDIFPKLLGSCGSLFAVEKLNSITGYWHLITLYDSKHQWQRRVKIALLILKFLQDIDVGVSEPLHICDVKMNHFGVMDDLTKVKYLNLDTVHPRSAVNKMTADGSPCTQHSECDFYDCRSFCNQVTGKCLYGVVNNNLQIVCERIFLGWVVPEWGRVMVPGLLLGAHTPRALAELLEACANPAAEHGTPRAPATHDIHKRLQNILTQLSVP